ncbi:MAG: SUMF1/EgtB/PvdO family nonheme iron enzyme [Bacteroidota bacterium]
MSRVFVSYSRKDIAFVQRLAADLKNAGIEVWYDVSGIAGGDRWRSEIENALRNCQYVIVVLSPDAILSQWVEREFLFSYNLKRKIIPLMYRSCEIPLNYVDLNIIDVQGDNYARNFYQILEALRIDTDMAKIKSPPHRTRYQYIALISGGAMIVVALLAAPWLRGMFLPVSPLPTSTLEMAGVPMSEPSSTATESLGATAMVPSPVSEPSEIMDSEGVAMMFVPAGSFTMGSDQTNPDEVPVHSVFLDSFYIDKYEVTNALYRACVDANVCSPPKDVNDYLNSQYADHPVVYVDWNMAKMYCEWRGAKLPTEAQWEKAARGTDGRTYPWGEDIDCSEANYLDCAGGTSSVTAHPGGASPYGIYDMAGNVWEWVADWYSDTYYQISPANDPGGPGDGKLKIVRGGAWNVGPSAVYSSLRNQKSPNVFDNDIGIRCARDVPPQ